MQINLTMKLKQLICENVDNDPFVRIGATSADPDYLLDCVLEGRGIRCPPFLRDLRT